MVLTCGLGCNRRPSPQAALEHARQALRRGNLIQAQKEAELGNREFAQRNPEAARKFLLLEAEALLLRGMYAQSISLLDRDPSHPGSKAETIEALALKGAAQARLHNFPEAERNLSQAGQECAGAAQEMECGDVLRARGVLLLQQGQPLKAKQLFEQTVTFARAHDDPFLAATALLNLGLGALSEQHFDEAIDWTESAYKTAAALDAGVIATKALGNLGWAYYNLGDSEKSLQLSLEAEQRALQAGDVIDQLSWITNAGYVYADRGDLAAAKQAYVRALKLATSIEGKEDIYNALRALALVSVEAGELDQAQKYSEEALAIARSGNNRRDELYPLLVEGMIASAARDFGAAERIFFEVERDPDANASLQWKAEHGLARVYEAEKRPEEADREYRAALETFEAARSWLRRSDSRLPFSSNASGIYDDYLNFLVAGGKSDEGLRWADSSRARSLTEGLGLLPKQIFTGPPGLNSQQIARLADGAILFYWLGKRRSYLWAITQQGTRLFPLPPAAEIDAAVQRYRKALEGPEDVLHSADSDGQYLYRTLVAPASDLIKKDARVFVIPDGSLNGLNFETLLVPGATLHYWIEDATISDASSLRVLGGAGASPADHSQRLLLIGNSVSPSEKYPELAQAADQMESVARHFPASEERVFARQQATPAVYLESDPGQFAYIHFVAHGTASRLSPLDSAIVLSRPPGASGNAEDESFKLYARDIVRLPLHADLVTISACYSAGERSYSGEGLVGLSWAFLRAGATHVVAALWEATDSSTRLLMDKFYDGLDRGASPSAALRSAKLFLLHNSSFHNPFYWAPFQIYSRLGLREKKDQNRRRLARDQPQRDLLRAPRR